MVNCKKENQLLYILSIFNIDDATRLNLKRPIFARYGEIINTLAFKHLPGNAKE